MGAVVYNTRRRIGGRLIGPGETLLHCNGGFRGETRMGDHYGRDYVTDNTMMRELLH